MSQPTWEVDPNDLRLPPSRASGADPWKLHQQVLRFGSSKDGMPPIFVYEDPDGIFELRRCHTSHSDCEVGARRNGPDCGDWALSPEPKQFPLREGSIMNENESRAELFRAFQALASIVPEMRCGQLMAAVGELCTDLHGRGLWDAADAELLEAVWQFRRGIEAATVSANEQRAKQFPEADRGPAPPQLA
jgi:hypothetical protein